MGLLSQGKPLKWADGKEKSDYVRHEGVVQFLYQYNKTKNRMGDNLKWGDEVDFLLWIHLT